jgi:hypothetical protein
VALLSPRRGLVRGSVTWCCVLSGGDVMTSGVETRDDRGSPRLMNRLLSGRDGNKKQQHDTRPNNARGSQEAEYFETLSLVGAVLMLCSCF